MTLSLPCFLFSSPNFFLISFKFPETLPNLQQTSVENSILKAASCSALLTDSCYVFLSSHVSGVFSGQNIAVRGCVTPIFKVT